MDDTFALPGYEILEKIGEGGTSSVWKARQLSLDRLVAIKTLSAEYLPDQAALERFRQEAQAAARLRHPALVQVFDAGEHRSRPYLVMEYISGCNVGDLLQQAGHLTEQNALLVADAVAQALEYAWDKDCLIHLDIKPDNILVENDGTVKVADLGLARFIGLHRRRPDSDLILGTPNYVSPEQAQGVTDLDCRTDIYSLGALLYHVVTGRLPFADRPGSAAMDAHVEDFLPDPVELNGALSAPMAWLIEKLMVKNRAYRPAYWRDVRADLAEVQAGRPPRPPLPEPGQSTVQRSPARLVPLPARPPVKVVAPATPRKRVVVAEAATVNPLLQNLAGQRGLSRATMQLFFLLLAAAALAAAFRMGVPQRIGRRVAQPMLMAAPVSASGSAVAAAGPEAEAEPLEVDWSDVPTAPVESGMQDGVVVWENEDFRAGARLYNQAYALYTEFQKTRENRAALAQVETTVRAALEKFEACKALAPPDVDVQGYIQQCFHLVADVRHSTLMSRETTAPQAAERAPALPAPPSSIQ